MSLGFPGTAILLLGIISTTTGCGWLAEQVEQWRRQRQETLEGKPPVLELTVSLTEVRLSGAVVTKFPSYKTDQPELLVSLTKALATANSLGNRQGARDQPVRVPRLSVDANANLSDVASVALTLQAAGFSAVSMRLLQKEQTVVLGEPSGGGQPQPERILYVAPLGTGYHLAWMEGMALVNSRDTEQLPSEAAPEPLAEILDSEWRGAGNHRAPNDPNYDNAVVLYRLDRPFSSIIPALAAAFTPRRPRLSGTDTKLVPAFLVWLYLPRDNHRRGAVPHPSGQDAVERQPRSELEHVYGAESLGLLPRPPATGDATRVARASIRVRMGTPVVTGMLPPEVVSRIVRQNYGRFRFCYESGLKQNRKLAGKVSVRFMVGKDGSVSNVRNAGSTLTDKGVLECITSGYYGLSFPQPEGGTVTVTFPILFEVR